MSKDKAPRFSLPDKVTVIKPEFANCKGCAQRVETYLKSVNDWQKAYTELEAKLAECVAALEFYAKNESWNCSSENDFGDQITYSDLEEKSIITKRKYVGGKRAREVLAKVKK